MGSGRPSIAAEMGSRPARNNCFLSSTKLVSFSDVCHRLSRDFGRQIWRFRMTLQRTFSIPLSEMNSLESRRFELFHELVNPIARRPRGKEILHLGLQHLREIEQCLIVNIGESCFDF